MSVCVFGPNGLQGTRFIFQIAQADTYDESKLSTLLFGIIVWFMQCLKMHFVYLVALVVTYKSQDDCKHLFMPMGPVCRAALGKCLWEHLRKHAHPWGGQPRGGWHQTHPPLHHHHWYCSLVNGSVRQYPLFLTSWTQPEASWHPKTPNTCPLPTSKIHTLLFLAACNPLIISVHWIWDDWVLKVLRRARSQDTEEQQERNTEGDRIFKGWWGVEF